MALWLIGQKRRADCRITAHESDRDIQRSLLAGFAGKRVDATVYLFNPGAADQFWVASMAVRF